MDTSKPLVCVRTSEGPRIVLAPVGPMEVWCCEVNDNLGEIVKTWRAGGLRRSKFGGKIVGVNEIGFYDGERRITVLEARPKTTTLRGLKVKHGNGKKSAVYGIIGKIETFPMFLVPELPQNARVEKPTVVARPLRWEVLPPGWWRRHFGLTKSESRSQELGHDDVERLRFIDSLQPKEWYAGEDYLGRRSYYVAVFSNCVVAESATYGNAVYIVFDMQNWRTILSHTKRQVLDLDDCVVSRIPHILDWRSKLVGLVKGA